MKTAVDQVSLWDEVPVEKPGQISGRDVYNAWCVSQQQQAKMLREFYTYHLEADRIERNLLPWQGLAPDTKKQFERMADALMQACVLRHEEMTK